MSRLGAHGEVPIAFLVERILAVSVIDAGLGGITLAELEVDSPWVKDYDAIKGEGPTRWLKRFDTSNWGLVAAYEGGTRIGGAVVALDSPDLHMLEGRRDLACLWDIRVQPEARSTGVGSALFRAVEGWSRQRGCRTLKVETQNINFAACRFYARMGCSLGAINRFAYPGLPDEIQLLWFKELGS
ncbi:MAG: GNAT family N-acetyltransferase [Candidatus Dormibacteria bacterium]